MIRMILSGCMGKMGHAVAAAASAKSRDFAICAGVDALASREHDLPFPVYTDIGKCTEKADVIVDFSRPDALPMLLSYAQKHRLPLVLASTGYNKNDYNSIKYASENIPILCSSNMSLGINLLKELSSTASAILNSTFDIEIMEKHHATKVDAPSGTAMMLADAVNEAAGGDLEYVFDRHERREARPQRELGLHALRGGTITGDHTVMFAGQDEVLELTHRAYSRNIYAQGALRAAEFIVTLPCGLYNMSSLLTQQQILTNVYYSEDDSVLSVSGITDSKRISAVFSMLRESDIMVDIVCQPIPQNGVASLSFSVPSTMAEKALRVIRDVTDSETVECFDNLAKITVEGAGMAHHAGAAGDVLGVLASLSIPVQLITTSETKITCCIPRERVRDAVPALKQCLTKPQ